MTASAAERGAAAERLAVALWPDLRLSSRSDDLVGIDARTDDGLTVQIKFDGKADRTGHLFWEIAKRGGSWSSYSPDPESPWHMSPCFGAHVYVFVSAQFAYRVPVSALVHIASNLTPILTSTAFAFLVPIARLRGDVEWRSIPRELRIKAI